MVISDLFDEYLFQLTPSAREFAAARRHRDLVLSRIKLEGVVCAINSGGYIKRTSIRPLEDIDLFIGFDGREYEKTRKRIVSRLAFYLRSSFPNSRVRSQTHSVGVTFSDMRVDVVPGFAIQSRPGYFHIRNRSDDRWVVTNIDGHKEFFKRRQRADARHRSMIQMVKAWKRDRRLKMSSYLMELLVSKYFDLHGIPRGRDVALYNFFEWLATGGLRRPVLFADFYARQEATIPRAPVVVLDPTNPRNNIAHGMDESARAELESVADRSRARVGTAIRETSRARAAKIWAEILPGFPSA